ncbi:hypothetical protein [Polymorphospora lycopeni]|uniref:Uncharacterized protein n=1 Tax=Polymorphospora lycopeni TaxID=3140240 RepID=A0ABV5CKT5_9ACTN
MTTFENGVPTYADNCPKCSKGPYRPALLLENAKGNGVVGAYMCVCGHRWRTWRAWWNGERHATDGRAAA